MSRDHLDGKAVEALNRLYARTPKNARRAGRQSEHSWKAVAAGLGFNVGYIYRVARGQKRASNRLLHALNLPARMALAHVCQNCGHVKEAKRCPHCRKQKAAQRPRRNWKGLALTLAGVLVTCSVDNARRDDDTMVPAPAMTMYDRSRSAAAPVATMVDHQRL